MNILLDYLFPITSTPPVPQASTAFLRNVLAVVKPKSLIEPEDEGVIRLITAPSEIATYTDNADVAQLFNAGLNRVWILANDDLDLETLLEGVQDFYTILVSSDFNDTERDAADFGTFSGVVATFSNDKVKAKTYGTPSKRVGFYGTTTTKAKNLFFAMGKFLAQSFDWKNLQYAEMPFADDVDTLGEAQALFDDKISFVLDDAQYGKRLGLFAAGGQAIAAPYILRNLEIDIQGRALQYIAQNQPQYTLVQASLLEDELNKVIAQYILRGWIVSGSIQISLQNQNFVGQAVINVPTPTALWRLQGEVIQS
jgi:hypothetical protein